MTAALKHIRNRGLFIAVDDWHSARSGEGDDRKQEEVVRPLARQSGIFKAESALVLSASQDETAKEQKRQKGILCAKSSQLAVRRQESNE